jgi:hypothetical protein
MTIYTHAGPVAQAFFEDNSEVAVIVGPFGSSKSTTSIQRLKRHMHEQKPDSRGVRSTRWLIVRNTYKQLKDATLPTWLTWFPADIYGAVDSNMRHIIAGRLPDGTTLRAECLFRAFDDPTSDLRNLLSLELTGCWANECREIPFETAMAILGRTGRWPAAGVKPTWSGLIGDTNPWYSESEWHKHFMVDLRPGYKLFHQPSGLSPEAENLANLPANYYEKMERDLAAEPEKLKVHCYSEWGALRSGQVVYPKYIDGTHCKPFELPRGVPLRIGIDFGIRACAAVLMYRSPTGVHHVVDEIVAFDQDLPSFCDALKARMSNAWAGHPFEFGVGDIAGNQRGLSGQSAFDIARSRGVFLQPASTNELSVRLAAVNKLLTMLAADGKPAFLMHPRCKWLREGFLYAYRFEQQRGTGRVADVPTKGDHSHVHDALQYVALRSVGAIFAAHGGAAGISHDQFVRGCAARGQQQRPDGYDIVFGNRESQRITDPRRSPFK